MARSNRDDRLFLRKIRMRRRVREQRSSMSGRVPCGKVAYLSKQAAKHYVRQFLGGLVERIYRCPNCGNWHLTSQRKAKM